MQGAVHRALIVAVMWHSYAVSTDLQARFSLVCSRLWAFTAFRRVAVDFDYLP